jgi:uncharacterized membrane protein SpoIIM required for sporulation
MSKSASSALFYSLLVGMGILFGVYIAFFAKQYADEKVRKSKRNREQYATSPTAKILPDYEAWEER